MQASSSLVPVTVLTGFLGSGKTTLLAALLRHPSVADTLVIVNEFGEVGLDHLLVAKGEENVVLLGSGCLCCAISNSLAETLADMHYRAVRGELPAFRRAVVETSGLAEPAPILQMLLRDPLVSSQYRLDGVVATIDGLLGMQQLDTHREAMHQAAFADRLTVTKTDLADPEALAALRRRLAALNPTAPILERACGAVAPADIVDIGLFDVERGSAAVDRWLRDEAAGKGASHRHYGVATFSVYLDGPVSWPGYAAWVEALRGLYGPSLLRVKGLLAIEDPERPYVVQAVQHVFSPPFRLPAWPSADRRSRLVFITDGLERAALEPALRLLSDPAAA